MAAAVQASIQSSILPIFSTPSKTQSLVLALRGRWRPTSNSNCPQSCLFAPSHMLFWLMHIPPPSAAQLNSPLPDSPFWVSAHSAATMADLYKLLQPLQFMQAFMKKGARPDGRKFDQFRNILLTCDCISTANGSAVVKLDTSSVICGITTSLVKPPTDQPDKGILDISVKFSNTCSTDLDNPDRTAVSEYVRECITKVLFHANVVDLDALCLVSRKHVWKLDLEIICLNMNGSIVDMSLLAALCALKFCKLRKYDVDLEFDLITATDLYDSLQVNCYPIFTTFSLINDNLLVDPLISEEELADSLIRIAVDSVATDQTDADSIYFFEVTGSKEIEASILQKCYQKAISRARFMRKIIDKHATPDASNRESEIKYEAMAED